MHVVPRQRREQVQGGAYHVFARGNNRQPIYRDDWDFTIYLHGLGRVVVDLRWSCLAYCLMHNHLHLLLETPDANLAAGMRRLHGSYAQGFNERHGRSGHVFQGRYGSVRIERAEHLLTVLGYIARNPVEAGLCEKGEQWRWNSYTSVLANAAPKWLDTPRLLGHLGALGGDPSRCYTNLAAARGQTP